MTGICYATQVFATDTVQFVHQPLGIIVAETPALAAKGASLVAVEYAYTPVRPLCLCFLHLAAAS